MSAREARTSLATPAQQGSLASVYRRSMVALHSLFGANTGNYAEREPLLSNEQDGQGSSSQYGAMGRARIRKPKKVALQGRVEAKVWFANERTWISWLRVSILIGSFALALFNSDTFFKNHHSDKSQYLSSGSIKAFGAVYAGIAILTLLWGLYSYQRRVTMIKTKYPGNFDDLVGPPLICAALFIAVLLNFIIRVKQRDLDMHP